MNTDLDKTDAEKTKEEIIAERDALHKAFLEVVEMNSKLQRENVNFIREQIKEKKEEGK